jgi:hypothetical protein
MLKIVVLNSCIKIGNYQLEIIDGQFVLATVNRASGFAPKEPLGIIAPRRGA